MLLQSYFPTVQCPYVQKLLKVNPLFSFLILRGPLVRENLKTRIRKNVFNFIQTMRTKLYLFNTKREASFFNII